MTDKNKKQPQKKGVAPKFFTIRADLSNKVNNTLIFSGVMFLLGVWSLIVVLFPSPNIPAPWAVIASIPSLHFEEALVRNLGYSIKLNILGYLVAIAISLPIGFLIGLFPIVKGMFNKPIDALRFLPLTACTGLFISWFGIYDGMKIYFLAFGITVYLLPMVVQRVSEVPVVYEQTVRTLGANRWQTIRMVFIPQAMAKLSDDIRVVVAISWTYIIVAELANKTGGIGAMINSLGRQSHVDKVFAVLIIIIIIGIVQDKALKMLDRFLFPHKYA